MLEVIKTIIKQLFSKSATNKFPAKYAPASTIDFLEKVNRGEIKLIPPVPVPANFRGKIAYDGEKCNGAIEYLKEEKKIKVFIARCCFCGQCVEVCPVHALAMTNEFLLSTFDKYAPELILRYDKDKTTKQSV
jgi:ferredoxin